MANAAPKIVHPYQVVCDTSDEAAWLRARTTGIGASEISRVLGIAPDSWGTEFSLFAEKVGAVPPRDLDDVEAVEWGKLLEPLIIRQYEKRTGRRSERCNLLLRSLAHPWALATLDGRTSDGTGSWPLEVKAASAFRSEDWADGPPEHYMAQVQQQLLVTGDPKATIVCLLGGQRMVWMDIERDDVWQRRIVFHGSAFWDRVQRRDPPDPDGTESTKRTLQALFPHDSGEVVELPMALAEIVDEWQQDKRGLKALEERIRLAENTIKATLGDATRGVLPTGDGVSWKEQRRAEHVVAESSYRVLRYHPNKKGK